MAFMLRAARRGASGVLAMALLDPWPWDINAQIQSALYNFLRFLTNVIFALDDALLGAARATLKLRNGMVDGGAQMIGSLFAALAPILTVGLFLVFMAAVVWYASRFLMTSPITTPERFVLVLLLATYLMANGVYAVQWVEFLRRGLGRIVYDASFSSARQWIDPAAGGQGVEPDCDLSRDDPDTALCNGYEFALSYLRFTDEDQVFDFAMPHEFEAEYFRVPPIEFASKSDTERDALLTKAQEGPVQALAGIPLAIMAVLEELVRFLLAFALLASFVGLAVSLIFGAFLPLGGALDSVVQQILRMFVTTAVMEMALGLFGGLLWVAQNNAVLFLSCGVLMLLADLVMVFQSGSLALRGLEGALLGSMRLGGPDMLRAGGFDQLGQAGAAVQGMLGRQGGAAGAGGREGGAGAELMPPQGYAGVAGARMADAEQAMNTAEPVMSPSSRPAGTNTTGAPAAAPQGQAGSGGAAAASQGPAGSSSGATAPAGSAAGGAAAGTGAPGAASGPGASAGAGAARGNGAPASGAASSASDAAWEPSAPAAAPVAPVYDPATNMVQGLASGREMSLEEYAAAGGSGMARPQPHADEGDWPVVDWPAGSGATVDAPSEWTRV